MNDNQILKIRQQRDLLTQTGPGTPGGELLRRYWQPIVLTSDFTEGSAPRAIRILSEDLVLFRDDTGRPGLLGLRCSHRGVDLSYGRAEDGGLRCIYHGWLYDVNGHCLEQPGEPGGGQSRDKIRQLAYPCVDRAGAIWTYMGPGEPPQFPDYPALSIPDAYRHTVRWHSDCNYLQANEGNVDPVHTSYLHYYDPAQADEELLLYKGKDLYQIDKVPRLSVQDTPFGLRVFADRRSPVPGKRLLRVTNFVMPNACAIGGAEIALGRGGASMYWHVPIDDTHHWRFEFIFHSKALLPKDDMERIFGGEKGENDVPIRNPQNRYLQDRDAHRWSYLGMGTRFAVHDLFVTESQGAMHDPSIEHLVTSDIAIGRLRRMMLAAVNDVAAGKDPQGVVRDPAHNRFPDLLVLTEQVDQDLSNEQVCEQFAQMDIYAPDPAVVEQAAAALADPP